MLFLDPNNGIEKSIPLKHVRRWGASGKSFTLDCGQYASEYVTFATPDGEDISQLISGRVDIQREKKSCMKGLEEDLATKKSDGKIRDIASLIVLQRFDGSFVFNEDFAVVVGIPLSELTSACPVGVAWNDWASSIAVAVFETQFKHFKVEWELLVKKLVNLPRSLVEAALVLVVLKGNAFFGGVESQALFSK
jgi:hypothetical protein